MTMMCHVRLYTSVYGHNVARPQDCGIKQRESERKEEGVYRGLQLT
jgi:hypothetical protein